MFSIFRFLAFANRESFNFGKFETAFRLIVIMHKWLGDREDARILTTRLVNSKGPGVTMLVQQLFKVTLFSDVV